MKNFLERVRVWWQQLVCPHQFVECDTQVQTLSRDLLYRIPARCGACGRAQTVYLTHKHSFDFD